MLTFKSRGKISFNKTRKVRRNRLRGARRRNRKSTIKLIQHVVNANAENKDAYKTGSQNYNSGIDNATDLTFLVPNISQGDADASRDGQMILAKSLRIKGHMIMNLAYNQIADCRIGVRLMIVQPKSYVGYDAIYNSAATWLAQLLKKGNSYSGFTGAIQDLYADINTESITKYYDRVFYLQSNYAPTSTVGNMSQPNSVRFFSKLIKFRGKGKTLLYDANNNSGLTPTNYNPVLILGYSHLNGGGSDTVDTQVTMAYTSELDYQDM